RSGRARCSSFSDQGYGRDPGAGGAAKLRVGEDEAKLADAVAHELGEVEVLDDEDAVVDVQRLRHLERAVGVLGRNGTVAPRVAAGDGHAAVGEQARELEAGAWLAREVRVRVVPVLAPGGVEEDGVARLE